ncbi:MAG: cation diffusion facilitator family transporter [Syntrophobacterales bacterium]|nr:cation diffusion facilitator family transporter [Syntrophobacterales bacterium]
MSGSNCCSFQSNISTISPRGEHSSHCYTVVKRSLAISIIFNLLIPIFQIIGGIYANSTAILSDALHNLGDSITLILTYIAFIAARKTATATHTFGYKRAEVIAAFFNTMIIVGASALILAEAVERFLHPKPILGEWVVGLALVGMIGNGISVFLLHRHTEGNMNIKSAFIHLLGDFLTSLGVLLGGIVLLFKPWYWIDPLLSFAIVVLIIKGCWRIFRDALRILMEATPPNVDLCKVKEAIEGIQGVLGAHYLHAWMVHPSNVAFSCHVVVEDQPLSSVASLRKNIEDMLNVRFQINHPILQFETAPCGTGAMICELACTEYQASNHDGTPRDRSISSYTSFIKSPAFKEKLALLLRVLFGGVFIFASLDKILNPKSFAEVIFNYHVLPDVLINFVAVTLPWVEFVTGSSLVGGWGVMGALAVLNSLLMIFIGLIIFNIIRGIDISCGCFFTEIENVSTATMWLEVFRDFVILMIGLWLFRYYSMGVKSNPWKESELK